MYDGNSASMPSTGASPAMNGYSGKNLSVMKKTQEPTMAAKSKDEVKTADTMAVKAANYEMQDHERKRKVELKCMEMQELFEEKG